MIRLWISYALIALTALAQDGRNRKRRPLEPILLPFDLNRDSKISRNEMAAAIRHLDTDGDKKVSPRELVGPGQREFDRYDLDGDGLLDESELRRTESLLRPFAQPKAKLLNPEAPLPPVPEPRGNPITPQKAVLGKILFWEQQLSSDDTVACGTCHVPTAGGGDPRTGRHPGRDGKLNTDDDGVGSPGIAGLDKNNQPHPVAPYGSAVQVTRRSSPSFFGSLYSKEQFWDGRAGDKLRDPIRNRVVLASGASLESQVLFPILDAAEMSHADRTWNQVTTKLSSAIPMARAKKLTPDVLHALARDPTYPRLFARAFGDPKITAPRIAMAVATYERTLVPDQTPFDAFLRGDKKAMSRDQLLGWRVFRQSNCSVCHAPPLFSDNTYRNIGLRPPHEDTGRAEVTRKKADRGRFKVASLRNVGLRKRFMHHGRLTSLGAVLSHYRARGRRFEENLDPLLVRRTGPGPARRALIEFLTFALTDPRVAKGLAPFDHPELGD